MTEVVIEKEAIKRLAKDVRTIMKNPLTDNGIYYIHDEDNILKGRALIMGPSDTPYKNGNYLFELEFPPNYPHMPPKVIYCTNDGVTRFNPNLYKCGKVCISILNTWRGDQWSSCQTITSVLLTICTVLNNNPLLNEPGITEANPDLSSYNKIVTYKNIDIAIGDVLDKAYYRERFPEFRKIMCKEFVDRYNSILAQIDENKSLDGDIVETNIYRLRQRLHYSLLRTRMETIYDKIKVEVAI